MIAQLRRDLFKIISCIRFNIVHYRNYDLFMVVGFLLNGADRCPKTDKGRRTFSEHEVSASAASWITDATRESIAKWAFLFLKER